MGCSQDLSLDSQESLKGNGFLNGHHVYLWLIGVVELFCVIYPRPGGNGPGMFAIPGIAGMAPGIWPFLPIFFIIVLIC